MQKYAIYTHNAQNLLTLRVFLVKTDFIALLSGRLKVAFILRTNLCIQMHPLLSRVLNLIMLHSKMQEHFPLCHIHVETYYLLHNVETVHDL